MAASPWTNEDKANIINALTRGGKHSPGSVRRRDTAESPQTLSTLLKNARVPHDLYYRGSVFGYEFITVLGPTANQNDLLHQVSMCEVGLQGEFPLQNFIFDTRYSPSGLSEPEREKLLEEGFRRYEHRIKM